jgi:hypothetical protein
MGLASSSNAFLRKFSVRGEQYHGGKKCKERISAILCANSDGIEKLPLLAVGKYAKPRC